MVRAAEITRYVLFDRERRVLAVCTVHDGPMHAGTTDDPAATFEHLFGLLVRR